MKHNVLKRFGRRCDTYAVGCPVCEAWRAYDLLFDDLTEADWERHRKG